MRQKTVITNLLKSAPGITKCDRSLLQSASDITKYVRQETGITKCDRLLLQSVSGIAKCDRLLLQNASGITKCGSYYKVRRNIVIHIFNFFQS